MKQYVIDVSEVREILKQIEDGTIPNYALIKGFEINFEHTETEKEIISKAYIKLT